MSSQVMPSPISPSWASSGTAGMIASTVSSGGSWSSSGLYSSGAALTGVSVGGVLGQGVAKSLGLKAGDRVNLVISLAQGAVNTLDFGVVGVFQSFSKDFNARPVRIPLSAARSLMDHRSAHLIVTGKHGQNALEELFLGSVTKEILSQSQCDILVSV